MKAPLKSFSISSALSLALITPTMAVYNPAIAQDEEQKIEQVVDDVFVEFRPITVSIIREYRLQGQLSVTFFLGVDKTSTVDEIERLRPRLRDGLVQSLTRVANTRVNPRRPVDLALIGRFMQNSVDEVLGKDLAIVLIQSAAAQPN